VHPPVRESGARGCRRRRFLYVECVPHPLDPALSECLHEGFVRWSLHRLSCERLSSVPGTGGLRWHWTHAISLDDARDTCHDRLGQEEGELGNETHAPVGDLCRGGCCRRSGARVRDFIPALYMRISGNLSCVLARWEVLFPDAIYVVRGPP